MNMTVVRCNRGKKHCPALSVIILSHQWIMFFFFFFFINKTVHIPATLLGAAVGFLTSQISDKPITRQQLSVFRPVDMVRMICSKRESEERRLKVTLLCFLWVHMSGVSGEQETETTIYRSSTKVDNMQKHVSWSGLFLFFVFFYWAG